MTAYQVMPGLTAEEYAQLRADIAAHGIRVPIDVDENGQVLDGHHRSLIAAELGVDCPRRVLSGLTEAEKLAHALAVNVHRRSLTREQRRALLAASIRSEPEVSDREHARRVGASPTTAGAVRQDLVAAGRVSNLDTRTDSTGRQQPATKPSRDGAEDVEEPPADAEPFDYEPEPEDASVEPARTPTPEPVASPAPPATTPADEPPAPVPTVHPAIAAGLDVRRAAEHVRISVRRGSRLLAADAAVLREHLVRAGDALAGTVAILDKQDRQRRGIESDVPEPGVLPAHVSNGAPAPTAISPRQRALRPVPDPPPGRCPHGRPLAVDGTTSCPACAPEADWTGRGGQR